MRQLFFLWLLLSVSDAQSLLSEERSRRLGLTQEAQAMVVEADQAYQRADYKKSTQLYKQAAATIPRSPNTEALREATVERYAQSAVELSKNLAKAGQQEFAKNLMDDVLGRDMAPSHGGALQMRKKLDDPIRNEPALTREHVREVDQVRRLLYQAESFYSLGQYDHAAKVYEKVLRKDPYNKAARRGLERTSSIKSDYYDAARDETRARMLTEVDAQWESVSNKIIEERLLGDGLQGGDLTTNGFSEDVELKLRGMLIESVNFSESSLLEAIDYLRQESVRLDDTEFDPERKGINFIVDVGSGESDVAKKILGRRFDLNLKGVPMEVVLEQVASLTNTSFSVERFAVVFRPLGADTGNLYSRSYVVPPDFLTREAVNSDLAGNDPFAETADEGAVLTKKMSAEEFLKANGIKFPEGAFANYAPQGSVLSVFNTRGNQLRVESLISAIAASEPIQVAIRVTIIDAVEDRLKELGYDWLLGSTGDSGLVLSGGTQGLGSGLGAFPFSSTGLSPVTSGNRFSSETINSLSDAIDRPRASVDEGTVFTDSLGNFVFSNLNPTSAAVGVQRSPGVLSLTGFLDTTQYLVMMRGLDQARGVDVMVKPEIVTRPGQVAMVESSRELIYPTEYEPPEIVGGFGSTTFFYLDTFFNSLLGLEPFQSASASAVAITPATPTAFETAKIGLALEVEPNVNRETGIINLRLNPQLRDLEGFINYGSPFTIPSQTVFDGRDEDNILVADASVAGLLQQAPDPPGNPFGADLIQAITRSEQLNDILMPVFNTTKIATDVDIYNGATVVIGGVIRSDMITVQDHTPFLGKLPYVGQFFKSESLVPIRRAVVILVNAEILDPSGRRISND